MKLLKDLKFNNFMLDDVEVKGLFEVIVYNCSDILEIMEIFNFIKDLYFILDIMLFNNIYIFRISL